MPILTINPNIMKKITLLFILLASFSLAFAQKDKTPAPVAPNMPIDEETGLITYKEVIPENGTATELYDRAMKWAKSFYKNTSEVIKSADREKGVIDMYSSVKIYSHQKDGSKLGKGIVYYTFRLECRDGRYRYIITNFKERATSSAPIEVWLDNSSANKKWDPECFVNLQEVDDQILELLQSLTTGMEPPVEKVDEW